MSGVSFLDHLGVRLVGVLLVEVVGEEERPSSGKVGLSGGEVEVAGGEVRLAGGEVGMTGGEEAWVRRAGERVSAVVSPETCLWVAHILFSLYSHSSTSSSSDASSPTSSSSDISSSFEHSKSSNSSSLPNVMGSSTSRSISSSSKTSAVERRARLATGSMLCCSGDYMFSTYVHLFYLSNCMDCTIQLQHPPTLYSAYTYAYSLLTFLRSLRVQHSHSSCMIKNA